ncbi:MAG: alanine dehydrogenase [Erysipelotrichaceae bacterium]
MIIGCVKEIKKHEYRVGLTPQHAFNYIEHGHSVLIEKNAGVGSGFSDDEYVKLGAVMIDTSEEVWARAEMIIKVKEPLPAEYPLIRENQILFTYLHLAADKNLTLALMERKAIGVAYETIVDRTGGLPLLKPMSEIAGRLSVQEGAKYLEKPFGGAGVLLAGVPGVRKGHVMVVGGGTVGTNAVQIAIGMGADVSVFDRNIDRLCELDQLFGSRIQTVYSTPASIREYLRKADVVIGAVLIPGASAPKVITKEMLSLMRKGSVLVDVAVDQGGCFETTHATYHDAPTFEVEGIIHYCVANMPGAVPRTSTIALTNATLRYGLLIADNGVKKAIMKEPGLIAGINTCQGKLTYEAVATALDLEFTPYTELC